jgi:two-component system, OmpR family, KDP operon response regulator KdpE
MTAVPTRVLLVEDDVAMRRFLHTTLAAHGYSVTESGTGADGLAQARTWNPEIVLLDLGLPDLDGLKVVKKLREWSAVPVIVLSARGQEGDKVGALDSGADDYLTKPFGTDELLARMRVALRHAARLASKEAPETLFRFGDVTLDLDARVVTRNKQEVHLTPLEYRLLVALVKHAGKVLTHRQLLHEVWGPGSGNQTHYLRVYMANLPQKLEEDPARAKHLLTEPGVGYRLVTPG